MAEATETKSAKDKLLEENELAERQFSVEMEDFFGTTDSDYDLFDEKAWSKGGGFVCPSFPIFNRRMEGLETGMYLVAGESNSGKSAFLMNLMYDYCTFNENDLFGIYFALDDTRQELIPRFISMRMGIPISVGSKPSRFQEKIDMGVEGSSKYVEYMEKRQQGIEMLREQRGHFKIEDTSKITCGEQIYDYLRKLKVYLDTNAPGRKIIAAIDSVSDIEFADPNFGRMNDKQKGDYSAKKIKDWSNELDIPIFGSIHLRKIEQNRRPTIADIKDSGRWVYEASWVGLVYNDVSRNKQSATIYDTDGDTGEKTPILELDWAKNKKSSYKGKTYHYFTPDFSQVTECSEEACKRYDALIYTN